MRRVWLPVLCVAVQFVSFASGAAPQHSRWTMAAAGVAGLLSGSALLWRHRIPPIVVGVTAVTYAIQVWGGGPVLPAAVAVATESLVRRAAPDGRPQLGASLVVVGALIGVDAAVVFVGSPFLAAPFAVLLLGAALLGTVRAARTARDREIRRELVQAERLRIARDLHDVVGHGVGAITVQAGAARMAITVGATADATQALLTIESAGRSVLREVRWLVGLLREDSERRVLTDVAELIGNARRSGMNVDLTMQGELADAPADAGEAAYRIVQEALTNVLRHSGVNTAAVQIGVTDVLQVDIVDGGTTADLATGLAEGNGVRGIRERVGAVSGTVQIGPRPCGGWSVHATLPLGRISP